MKKYFCFLMIVITLFATYGCTQKSCENKIFESDVEAYSIRRLENIENQFIKKVLDESSYEYRIYDASELTCNILENRKGTIIVERYISQLTDSITGQGCIINAYNKECSYINYSSTQVINTDGSVYVSYVIYNPENNFIDDIIGRYDCVLSENIL